MAVDAGAPAPTTEAWPPYADPAYRMPPQIEVTVHKRNEDDVTLTASQPGVIATATVWQVGSIWVTPDEVKQTPRRDAVVEMS